MIASACYDSGVMVIAAPPRVPTHPRYLGLRLSAEEYLALPDDGFKYQLINGVVIMSASPTFGHQDLLAEILSQLRAHLRTNPIGKAVAEVDVQLAPGFVYRPDAVFVRSGSVPRDGVLTVAPDLAIEIVSPSSEAMDLRTKRADYERYGVKEYWIVEPAHMRIRVLKLRAGKYEETLVDGDSLASDVVTGFVLDMRPVKQIMR